MTAFSNTSLLLLLALVGALPGASSVRSGHLRAHHRLKPEPRSSADGGSAVPAGSQREEYDHQLGPQQRPASFSTRSSKFYDRCPAHGMSVGPRRRHHTLAGLQSKSRTAQACTLGTEIGFMTATGYSTSCCFAFAYCGGCGLIDNGRCILCKGGYRLMGQMGYQKCTMCDDMDAWTDAGGLTCADYERLGLCNNSGAPVKDLPNKGLKPSDACCACGGGDIEETPWSYPLSGHAFTTGQTVNIKAVPQTAFRYEIDAGCGLTDLNLTMDENGEISGTLPENASSDDGSEVECLVTAVQDPLTGLKSTQPLVISMQELSYGPQLIIFALKDGVDWPTGQVDWRLINNMSMNFNLTSYSCMPAVPWIDIAADGTLSYVVGATAVSGGIEGSGFDGGQCTLKGVIRGNSTEKKLTFMVLKVHVWSLAEYTTVVHARNNRPIVPLRLTRRPPVGFSLYKDPATGKEYWYKAGASVWTPPAAPPMILDVNCTGAEQVRWSRRTGAVTVMGRLAFYLSPADGEISGTPRVDLPERLGQASVAVRCHLAAGGPWYDEVLTATAEVRLVDDTCYFTQVPRGPVNAMEAAGPGTCAAKCRKLKDCSGYWEESTVCWVITSRTHNSGVSKEVASFTARAKCEEGATCIRLSAPNAKLIEGKYCPQGRRDEVTVYCRSGATRQDELYLAFGLNNGTCPVPGHSSTTQYWVVRSASESDYMNPETGETELRGAPLACLAGDIERETFESGSTSAALSLASSVYAGSGLTAQQVANHRQGLTLGVSLTANECTLSLEGDSMLAGPYPSQSTDPSTAKYSLGPCECFGKKYRDMSPVTEESRRATGSPAELVYNNFEPPPMLIFEGPYVCEHEAILPNGQKNEISEDDCRTECSSEGSVCKFFLYVPQLRYCLLLSQCNRLGHSGLETTHKLFGVFPAGRYCRIANPELCWASKMRRDLIEGQFEGSSLASGAATGPADAGGSDNCAFQEQLAQCDAMQMLTTESRGACSRCEFAPIPSKASAGLSKVPMPSTFLSGSQVVLSCDENSRLINSKTGRGMEKAVITCVDGEWQDAGFLEGITATSRAGREVTVMEHLPQPDEKVYSDEQSVKFTSLGDFSGKNLLYIRGADAEKTVAADSVVWTLETPVPVVIFLDFWGGEPSASAGCSAWLKAPDSGWVKTRMSGSAFHNGGARGPGVVYRQDFPAGVVEIMGNANCGTGNFLAFVDPLDPSDSGGGPLGRLQCADCIQLAQPEYGDLLRSSAPEVYYLMRRRMQYHFGEVSSGCKTASRATPATLSTEEADSCLTFESVGSMAIVNRDCSELWILDSKKRLVTTTTNSCMDEQGVMQACSSCDSGAASCTWHFDHLSRLRNSNQECLRNNAGTLATVTCATVVPPQEKWSFDGGDCRYKMEIKSTDIPLMWRFTAGDGATYGAEIEEKASQALTAAKASIPPMANGNCDVTLKASLSGADAAIFQNISLQGPTGALGSDAEYSRSMVWKVNDGAYFACSPGGAGGVKSTDELLEKIANNNAKITELRGSCDPAKKAQKKQDAENTDWVNGWDSPVPANPQTAGKAITSIHSQHNNEKEDRLWKFTYSEVVQNTEPHGNPTVSIDNSYFSLGETGWDAPWDKECPQNYVMTRQISSHDNGREDRIFTWYCSQMHGVLETADSRSDWSAYTDWDATWTYPSQPLEASESKWLVGVSSYHDNEREDRRFRWKEATFCKIKDPEIAMLNQQIAEYKATLNSISSTEVTCAHGFLMPIGDIENLDASYPAATDVSGNAITISSKAAFKCHMMHLGDPGPMPAYTMTAPQLVEMVAHTEYHVSVGADPREAPFKAYTSEATEAMKVGYYTQIDHATTVWGIQCPKRSVVAAHEKAGSPHCIFLNAEEPELVMETQLPASAKCPLGYAMSGWWNLFGHFTRRAAANPGGPEKTTGFEFRCRLVPGLSRICEDKESKCLENEVIVGIKYEKGKKLQYRCCRAPKTVGQLFASRHLADVRPWEGKYCPGSLDSTGRPVYRLERHLGPNDNRHGSEAFSKSQFTVPPPETADTADRVLMCPSGQLVAQWRQISGSPRRYAYTCVHVGLGPETANGLHPDGCTTSASGQASCTGGSHALQGFILGGSDGAVKSRTCCRLSAGSEELTGQTAEAPAQNPGTADVRCGEGEVMHSWSPSGLRYDYKCQGFWQKTWLRGEASTLLWDKLKGAWTISQAEVYQLRTPVRSGQSGSMSAMAHHPLSCDSGHLMKGWLMLHHGGGTLGKISFAVQCAKVELLSSGNSQNTAGSASQLSHLTSHDVDCGSNKALQALSFSSRFTYTCGTPKAALTSCESSHTGYVPATSNLFGMEGLPAVCPKRGQVLQRLVLQSGARGLRFQLTCCQATFSAHQEAGVVSNAGLPTDLSPTDVAGHDRVPGKARLVGGARVEIWLAGKQVTTNTQDMNVVTVHPVSGQVVHSHAFLSAGSDGLATLLNGLAKHTVVLVSMKGAGLSNLNSKAIFALQRCGSTLTSAGSSSVGYVLIGVVEGRQVAEQMGNPVEIEAAIPAIYIAAPFVDFEASFVQEVSKADPFPKEKPMKPALLTFTPKEPEYDPYCNPAQRRGTITDAGDPTIGKRDSWEPVENAPTGDKTHPCFNALTADSDGGPITAARVWDCSQRDIDREYLQGLGEVWRQDFEAQNARLENIFDWVELGVTLAAAAATAIPWGSFAVPGSTGAENGVEGSEKAARKLQERTVRKRMQKQFLKKSRKTRRAQKASRAKKGEFLMKTKNLAIGTKDKMKANKGDVAEGLIDLGMGTARASVRKGISAAETDKKKTWKDPLIPEPKMPDEFGFSDAENMEAFSEAGWTDCDPTQWGMAKILCDLYCTEDAVRKGTESVNANIANSHQTMMVNMERLLDYHTKMAMWGLGQVRDQLLPPAEEVSHLKREVSDRHQEVKGVKQVYDLAYSTAMGPGDTPTFIQELRRLTGLLATNTSSPSLAGARLPESVATWHRTASAALVRRLDGLLETSTPRNGRELARRAAELVQHYVAERELRFSQPLPLRREEAAGELAEERARAMRKSVEVGRRRLRGISSMPKPVHFGGLALRNDEVVIRWNQLADFFVKAHERHAVFVESRSRALDAAEATVHGVDYYLACGLDQTGLHELWQKSVQAEEHADDALLEAWVATVAAQERLMMSVKQGLIQRMVMATTMDPELAKDLRCNEGISSFASQAYSAAVKSVDHSLWVLAEQLLALERAARYQEGQLRSRRLKAVQRVPLDGVAAALYEAAAAAADPEDPAGRELAARALDVLGPRACPAPAPCQGPAAPAGRRASARALAGGGHAGGGRRGRGRRGGRRSGRGVDGARDLAAGRGGLMRLANASFGAWVAAQPGELLRGSGPEFVAMPCVEHANPKEQISLMRAMRSGLISATEMSEMEHALYRSRTPICDEQCRSELNIHLAPQRSVIAEAMLKLR